jgi:hypothetical protein
LFNGVKIKLLFGGTAIKEASNFSVEDCQM